VSPNGFGYDRSGVHRTYDVARRLPAGTLKQWMEAIAGAAPQEGVHHILDLGCGTGRFAIPLAERFSAQVIGIDLSEHMLRTARRSAQSPEVTYLCARAESLPIAEGGVDLIFMSMVYHHLHDKEKALREARRVLAPDGRICIRTSTVGRMDSYLWVRFFPEARDIEIARAPSAASLIATAQNCGLELAQHRAVSQVFAHSWNEYVAKIGARGLSSLRMISDARFRRGLEHLRAYAATQSKGEQITEEIDLFVFSRR
jgi:ubiquinone/menaquinone biosynthesis C-methylase UbiE